MDDREREFERAVQLGYRAVGSRERTVAELRTFLERKRVEPEAIDDAVRELTEAGFLDDARYAQRFAEDKRELRGWGPDRIREALQGRGLDGALIEAAVAADAPDSQLERAIELLERRGDRPHDE
ncbi:MAG TPA: RecX family transcriptional regulator, partial [Solirubrobacterales bacterium]|nr:RecX family transcriptional regulator [Solirubrobacterales bacterium]